MILSLWHFSQIMEDHDLKDPFELFCKGVSMGGPYCNNVLGCWRTITLSSLKEEVNGVMESIINLCRFENLSSLEVDQTGPRQGLIGMVKHGTRRIILHLKWQHNSIK
ncbi:flavonol 4'-sulfotransferase [Quercus suber]|uniref:Flavonol 4'-sulfotransferase n=1 Tax=Quercus suber TaxID=58331 RepID=A0AAW0MC99_QUESU